MRTADVFVDYEDGSRLWISLKGTRHSFRSERACFQFIATSVKKRDLAVVLFEPSIRANNKAMRAAADRLQDELVKLKFSRILFVLGSAEGTPIYRLFQND